MKHHAMTVILLSGAIAFEIAGIDGSALLLAAGVVCELGFWLCFLTVRRRQA